MRQSDRYTDFDRTDFHPEAQAIIEATTNNRRIFPDEPVDDADPLVDVLKYTNKPKQRANFREVEAVDSSIEAEKAERILDLLGYDQGLKFQFDAWEKYDKQFDRLRRDESHQGLMVTAPTGFGKTACFMGSVVRRILDERHKRAVFVYPSRALLQDQFARLLEIVHTVQEIDSGPPQSLHPLSVGVYYGNQPYDRDDLFKYGSSFTSREDNKQYLDIVSHWDDAYDDRRFEISKRGYDGYRLNHSESGVEFTDDDVALHRSLVSEKAPHRAPDIVLTTLESLENIAMKPHYNIVSHAETIVFDEVHQYTGLRGTHAAKIVENIKRIKDESDESIPTLLIGSSATLEQPEEFGRELFGFGDDRPRAIDYIEPRSADITQSEDDLEHYYFALTPRGGPGASSLYIQQAMMVGRSLLEPDTEGTDVDQTQLLSFIDSKSQINQLQSQLQDADHNQELWREHIGIEYGDWKELARRTNHRFRDGADNQLNIVPMHADSETNFDDLSRADIIQATSYLEMGIDIDALQYVVQYRPPNEISTFEQRAGRAGRIEGLSSHVFVLLSSFAGDANFYYRAGRFLDSDVTTPLYTDNSVIEWMHERFHTYYETLAAYQDEHPDWYERTPHEPNLLRLLFDKRLGWSDFTTLLLSPAEEIERLTDVSIGANTLLYNEQASDIESTLSTEIRDVDKQLRQKAGYLQASGEDLGMSSDPAERALVELRKQTRQVGQRYLTRRTEAGLELPPDFDESLGNVSPDPSASVQNQFAQIRSELEDLDFVRAWLNRQLDGSVAEQELNSIKNTLDQFTTSQGEIESLSQKRKLLYYLEQAVREAKGYSKYGNQPHGSLYLVKNLFRAAYYHQRAREVAGEVDETEAERLWFVPPNYFSDSGRYYKLASESPRRDEVDQSVDTILGQYIPFKSEFVDDDGTMNLFHPDLEVTDDGVQMNFSDLTVKRRDDILVPERVKLREVSDVTGRKAKQIVPYCAETYEILKHEDAKPPGGPEAKRYGKVHSSADIATRTVQETTEGQLGKLELGELEAKAWIDGVTLEIKPDTRRNPDHANIDDKESVEMDAAQRLGYKLDTRGVTWHLDDIVGTLLTDSAFEDVRKAVRRFHGESTDIEQVILDTAGHLLTLLISDTAGVSARLLRYSIQSGEESERQLTVFEQTEGGQGIVDLFMRKLRQDPGDVMDSIYELTHNPQIICEHVWATPAAVKTLVELNPSDVFAEEDSEEYNRAAATVDNLLRSKPFDYRYQGTIDRITQELFSQLRNIESFAVDRGFTEQRQRIFNLKHDMAKQRLAGEVNTANEETDVPESIRQEYYDIESNVPVESLERAFWSPDIDDCELNLQLPNVARQASDVQLSNVVLRALVREFVLTEEENTGNPADRLAHEVPPAWKDEEIVRYVGF